MMSSMFASYVRKQIVQSYARKYCLTWNKWNKSVRIKMHLDISLKSGARVLILTKAGTHTKNIVIIDKSH